MGSPLPVVPNVKNAPSSGRRQVQLIRGSVKPFATASANTATPSSKEAPSLGLVIATVRASGNASVWSCATERLVLLTST